MFQTSDPKADNFVSAEYVPNALHAGQTAATVQSLAVRFDQKGHERPFQKAVIIDVVDGYINPGDKIIIRMGDRRFGARGTRAQTFVEKDWRMRWYIDPVGTSRFAAIRPDISIRILPGEIAKAKLLTPRVVRPGVVFPVHLHTEDAWGNATVDQRDLSAKLTVTSEDSGIVIVEQSLPLREAGWTFLSSQLSLPDDGDYIVSAAVVSPAGVVLQRTTEYISVSRSAPSPRILFGDLHVHSDDTVGTNDTSYNFSYAQKIAGLDVVGYTANDFNITAERWEKTLDIIRQVNAAGEVVVFPGTEWCGNSAAGGDHNVVFLDDPQQGPPEFPLDKKGNVARSFEWNEDGPAELAPGAWPLDEVYATYAHNPEGNLMIPHVGGRRCNLAWHHPQLERLLEIGSAWGTFEWLLRDAMQRGWRLGVCANSDEHRGRCGGGVPGTAVFGVTGGLTGVLADELESGAVAKALRARRTFATTGERLVGLACTEEGALQGDDTKVAAGRDIKLKYAVYGAAGFSSIEAWDADGCILQRNLRTETAEASSGVPSQVLVVKWGGARLYDRYREAVWNGTIAISGANIESIQPFGGVLNVPEEEVTLASDTGVTFHTRTSGDSDGVIIKFSGGHSSLQSVTVSGSLGGYVKVGDALRGNPHKPQPSFDLGATAEELSANGGKTIDIKGGVDLFVTAELVLDVLLPRRVEGDLVVAGKSGGEHQSVYFVGREWTGAKVITSPIFVDWE